MYDLKTILLAKRIRRKLDVTRLSVADIALLEIIKNASDNNPVRNATIENGIATFNGVTVSKPLVSLLLNIPVTQTGSGTPSPTNIRDFIGVNGVTITRNNGVDAGDTYLISFGQTVYSAILDVLTGKLYLTHELKTIDENSDVQRADNGILFVNSFFEISEDTDSVNCNVYQRGENRGTVAQVNANNPDLSFCCKLGTNTDRLMIKDTRFTTIDDYKTWLSTNPVKIAVKLATPIEIQLTPTVINTLIGDNVIFADVGDITECKYTRK